MRWSAIKYCVKKNACILKLTLNLNHLIKQQNCRNWRLIKSYRNDMQLYYILRCTAYYITGLTAMAHYISIKT